MAKSKLQPARLAARRLGHGEKAFPVTEIWAGRLSNAESVQSFSPGLIAQRATPGLHDESNHNPVGVESIDPTPTGLRAFCVVRPGVDCCAINPGLTDGTLSAFIEELALGGMLSPPWREHAVLPENASTLPHVHDGVPSRPCHPMGALRRVVDPRLLAGELVAGAAGQVIKERHRQGGVEAGE